MMPQKRLPEASDELGGTNDVVELGSREQDRPEMRAASVFRKLNLPPAPSAKNTTSAFIYELGQRLTGIINYLGGIRRRSRPATG